MSAPLDLLLRSCRLPDGRVVDLGCHDGRIVEIGTLAGRPAAREIACEGRVVTPGLVDAHIHLDKAWLNDRAPSREGSLAEALRVTAEAKRGFTRGTSWRGRAARSTWRYGKARPPCAATPRWIPSWG